MDDLFAKLCELPPTPPFPSLPPLVATLLVKQISNIFFVVVLGNKSQEKNDRELF